MPSIHNMVFVLQLLTTVTIFFILLWNTLMGWRKFDLKVTFLYFSGFLLAWASGLVVKLYLASDTFYMMIFYIEDFLLALVGLFFIIHILVNIYETIYSGGGRYRRQEED